MAATIGALRVVLGADTAQFSKGIRGATSDLTLLQKSAKVAGVALGVALAAGVAGAVSFAGAIRNAINEADKMGKLAQSIGVPVEALSKLAYAAKFSELSVEELGSGIARLNRALIDAQQNSLSPAAQAFKALGVNIEGATSGADLIPQMSDAFRRLGDGAGKTDVSMQLFGRNLGAKFIPFLNEGAASIARLGEEAVALGHIFTGEMAQAADEFNDNMDRLKQTSSGLAIQWANQLLPTLNSIVEKFVELNKSKDVWGDLFKEIMAGGPAATLPALSFEGMQGDLGTAPSEKAAASNELADALNRQAMAATAAKDAQQLLDQTIADGVGLAQQALSPWDEYRAKIEALTAALNAGKISAEQMGNAQVMAAASAISPWLNVASTIGGALGQLFEDNKGVAIAQALINTAQGVTAALAQYPPPLSFAMAAAQAAAGAAQIATIKSTKPGSGGSAKRPSVGGGSGRAASGNGRTAAAGDSAQRAVNITLMGSSYSAGDVRDLINAINKEVGDGARLRITPA
jgi:hypothetical protein